MLAIEVAHHERMSMVTFRHCRKGAKRISHVKPVDDLRNATGFSGAAYRWVYNKSAVHLSVRYFSQVWNQA